MINDDVQTQSGGDHSTNVQAKNLFVVGVSATEASQIALNTFRANFEVLSQEASQIAFRRVKDLTDSFFEKVLQSGPFNAARFQQPDIQIALLDAQREYARSGDKAMEGMLVELLVELSRREERTLLQVALEDALKILPKLTASQTDMLTLNMLIKEKYFIASSVPGLRYFISILPKFMVKIEFDSPDLSHVESVGCARIEAPSFNGLAQNLRTSYPGLFCRGFTRETFDSEVGLFDKYKSILVSCAHDSGKLQLNAVNLESVVNHFSPDTLETDERMKILNFMKSSAMSVKDINSYLVALEPRIEPLFSLNMQAIFDLKLTPIGAVIARANFFRKTGHAIALPYRMRNM